MTIGLLLAALLAGQSSAGHVTALRPGEDRPQPAQPTATLVVEPAAMAIAACDADGDGRTSRAELNAGLQRSFALVDTGHAGKLRPIAYADWATRFLGSANALPSALEADSDGDDAVSLPELQAAFGRVFDRLDKDRDGFVTRPELLTVRSGLFDRGAGDKRGRKGQPPR